MQINVEREDIKKWLADVHGASKQDHYKGLWRRVLALSSVPARRRASVNIFKVNKYSEDGDYIVVPGKILSEGTMEHKVHVTAMEFSAATMLKLKDANCKVLPLEEMLKQKKIKIII